MMRYILILGIVFLVGCSTPGCRVELEGMIEGGKYGTALLVSADSSRNILLSSEIDEGKFAFSGNLPGPGEYILKINHLEYPLLLEQGRTVCKCNVVTDWMELTEGPVWEMSKEYERWMGEKYKPKLDRIVREYWDAQKHPEDKENLDQKTFEFFGRHKLQYNAVRDFIQAYPNCIFSVQKAREFMKGDYERGHDMYGLLSPEMQQSVLGKQLYDEIQIYSTSALGSKIPAIEVETEDGETGLIENLQGIWVIDFWASWCSPCRNEMVYLKEMYPEVHKFGVNIVSISMDDDPVAWKKVNAEEQIPWKSVRNKYGFKQGGIRDHLRFNAIPYILLVKDGRIVARNLRRGHLKNRILELLQE